MNHFKFFFSVAVLLISILSQNVYGSPSRGKTGHKPHNRPTRGKTDHKLPNRGMVHRISGHTLKDYGNYFKHDALLVYQKNNMCSGSIISDQHILTAAHCVTKLNSSDIIDVSKYLIEVRVGIKEVYNPYEYRIIRAVETIFLPKKYFCYADPDELKNTFGDIAVLKLNHRLGLDSNPNIEALNLPRFHVPPRVRLQEDYYAERQLAYTDLDDKNYVELQKLQENYYTGRQLTYTGFGNTNYEEYDSLGRYYPHEIDPARLLHYSDAYVVNTGDCLDNHQTYKLCAYLNNTGYSTTCKGDSGGALFDKNNKEIIGVVSIGFGYCEKRHPTTYTRVIAFIDMIEQAIYQDAEIPGESRRISFKEDTSYRKKIAEKEEYTMM